MILQADYFQNENVIDLAKDLIGKILFTRFQNQTTACIITETEAYAGITDKASHAYNNKRTARTETMYHDGGCSYIYLIYGIHSLFNVVSNMQEIPHAVLIRGGYPIIGLDIMKTRTSSNKLSVFSLDGPGKLSKHLNIHHSNDGILLEKPDDKEDGIWIEDLDYSKLLTEHIVVTPRIGINYAEEDTLLPYRFIIPFKNNTAVGILEKISEPINN